MDLCARMNCDNEAVALLSFAPRQAKAWLSDLTEPNPATGIVLCRRHANATVVPMSWQLVDARDPNWMPASERQAVRESVAAVAEVIEPVPAASLPSDAAHLEREFAALDNATPVAPQPWAEMPVDVVVGDRTEALLLPATPAGEATRLDHDPSLFELPIGDIPAVTPHPGWR